MKEEERKKFSQQKVTLGCKRCAGTVFAEDYGPLYRIQVFKRQRAHNEKKALNFPFPTLSLSLSFLDMSWFWGITSSKPLENLSLRFTLQCLPLLFGNCIIFSVVDCDVQILYNVQILHKKRLTCSCSPLGSIWPLSKALAKGLAQAEKGKIRPRTYSSSSSLAAASSSGWF